MNKNKDFFYRIKEGVIIIAIALVLAFFVGYGIEVFNDGPDREDYCSRNLYEIRNEADCTEAGGEWDSPEVPALENDKPVLVEREFCREGKRCYEDYEQARTKHDKIVFIVAVIAGLLAIFSGIALKKDVVSTGVVTGGVLLILYGTIRYWRHADNILKFILLGIALTALIWLAYKKLDKGD
jgi:hypothetical protein